eukprot:TRINITY_DN1025_c0_g1_i1.p1 TRINITY_DN1025_c0_g1~~TRINITY_DN1025_c0_g1_i1.p1  ORF type:complete len:286 (+),score=38.06 TRINITY_DN1025_c0_g1_i1:56-859(+)
MSGLDGLKIIATRHDKKRLIYYPPPSDTRVQILTLLLFSLICYLRITTVLITLLTILSLFLLVISTPRLTKYVHNKWHIAFRAMANSQKPKRIILFRHGESEGNINHEVYAETPDNQVKLTLKGEQQARDAGMKLRKLIGDETVRFFVSPYERSWRTLECILETSNIPEERYTIREEPRLREQDWGNFQDPKSVGLFMKDRLKFGSFYYRLPNGESGADVYDRVTTFWSTLHREWKFENCLDNFVIVSHGITCRMFLMRYYNDPFSC